MMGLTDKTKPKQKTNMYSLLNVVRSTHVSMYMYMYMYANKEYHMINTL